MSQRRLFYRSKRNDFYSNPDSINVSLWRAVSIIRAENSRYARSGATWPQLRRSAESGFIVFGASFILFLTVATVGLLEFRAKSERNIRLQVELDQCIGRIALKMKAFYYSLSASVKRIQTAERTTKAICIATPPSCPPALSALKNYTHVEKTLQISLQQSWQLLAWTWNTQNTCKRRRFDLISPFPDFPLDIPTQTLDSKTQYIWVQSHPIHSCAKNITHNQTRMSNWALEAEPGCHP